MLGTDDRGLIDRDPAVPGLAVVLDPEAMLELVRSVVGDGVGDGVAADAVYARYKPATSCVVGYRVTTADGCRFVYAKAVRRSDGDKLAKASEKASEKASADPDGTWPVVTCAGQAVYVADALHDRDLPALRVLGDGARRGELLRRLFPDDERAWSAPVRAIRHKPQRRWIGVVDLDGAPAYRIKTYRPSEVGRAHAGQSVVGAIGSQPTGWSHRRAAVGSAWIEGRAMSELLGRGEFVDAAGVGAALAEIHRRPPSKRLHTVRAAELRHVFRTAADAIGSLVPELGEAAAKIARRAGRELPTDGPRTLVHGDFSADQVVIANQQIHLIDFDESANGHPSLDLASFLADVTCAEIEGTLTPGTGAAAFDELLDGYRRAGALGNDDVEVDGGLGAHLAGALLRRAVLPFRERRPEWSASCERIVEAASRALGERRQAGRR